MHRANGSFKFSPLRPWSESLLSGTLEYSVPARPRATAAPPASAILATLHGSCFPNLIHASGQTACTTNTYFAARAARACMCLCIFGRRAARPREQICRTRGACVSGGSISQRRDSAVSSVLDFLSRCRFIDFALPAAALFFSRKRLAFPGRGAHFGTRSYTVFDGRLVRF